MRVTIVIANLGLLLAQFPLHAKPVRATFLKEGLALHETLSLLRAHGFRAEETESFRKVVEHYNAACSELDLRRFPLSEIGFFRFESPSELIAALPHKLYDTVHGYDLNCFDAVILLAKDSLRTRLGPDDVIGQILAPHNTTNGVFMILPAANARDAFGLVYPMWYQEATRPLFPQPEEDSRICLVASLFQCHVLPLSTTEGNLEATVIEVLTKTWKRQIKTFPQKFEVVLCHQVSLPARQIVTAHAGLLLRNEKGFILVEKAGGSGPFVRCDFEELEDLRTWLAANFNGAGKLGYTHHFVTFNDSRIESLSVELK